MHPLSDVCQYSVTTATTPNPAPRRRSARGSICGALPTARWTSTTSARRPAGGSSTQQACCEYVADRHPLRGAAAARAKSPRATNRGEGHGAYPADRKTFPIDKWNLASRRLRKHCSITTISVMTLFTQKGHGGFTAELAADGFVDAVVVGRGGAGVVYRCY